MKMTERNFAKFPEHDSTVVLDVGEVFLLGRIFRRLIPQSSANCSMLQKVWMTSVDDVKCGVGGGEALPN